MRAILSVFTEELNKRKREYTFLFGLILTGITFGAIFMTLLDKHDKLLVINQITAYFDGVKNNDLSYFSALKENIISNLTYVLIIWILGLSVIGIPIILFLIFFKGFIMGFSIASIVYKYKISGIFISFFYIFPHHLFSIIIIMILSYYSLNFSVNFIHSIINKKTINFNIITNRYLRILLLSIFFTCFISLFEVFIVPSIIKFLLVFFK